MSKLNIYSASAGAGKTYTLTLEYLKLVFKHPSAFKSVMAVTFTNKATEEMKHRIIEELANLASGKDGDHRQKLKEHTRFSEAKITSQAQEILNNVLHQYSFFGVSTIDSFFQKIIRNFVKEAGLAGGLTIDLDQNKVIDKVVDQLFERVGKDAEVTRWILKYAGERIKEGRSWNVRSLLKELAQEILREDFKIIEEAGFTQANLEELQEYIALLEQQNNAFTTSLSEIGTKGLRAMEEAQVSVEDFSYKSSGVAGYFQKVAQGGSYEIKSRVQKCIDDPENGWFAKSSKKKDLLQVLINEHLHPLLVEAKNLINQQEPSFITNSLILDNIYVFGVYSDLLKELKDYRTENNVLLISDITDLLNKIIGDNHAPYIYEKIGNHYQHFLVDEFQDTSKLQWRNFEPLISNSLASGNKNLIVGDVKQAIYRWRGGDWKLLLNSVEKDIGSQQVEKLSLDHNWRSLRNIITFNNDLYKRSSTLLKDLFSGTIESYQLKANNARKIFLESIKNELLPNFQLAYEDVFQKTILKEEEGWVTVDFCQSEESSEQIELALEQSLHYIDAVLEAKGKLKDICILVRNGFEGERIAQYLAEMGTEKYPFVSSASFQLKDNPFIKVIIGALTYLHQGEDEINLFELVLNHQEALGNDTRPLFASGFIETLKDEEEWNKWLPAELLKERSYLNKLPIYELCEKIIRIFNITAQRQAWAFLQTFQDAVLNFGRKNNPDIFTFLEWWHEKGGSTSPKISDAQDAIRIMTVHKSKGLQFKHVIVPFCNWKFNHDPKKAPNVWGCTQQEPYSKYPYFPVPYKKSLAATPYALEYFDEMQQCNMENINILYVATTRAEESLHLIANLPSESKKELTSENLACNELLYLAVDSQSNYSKGTLKQPSHKKETVKNTYNIKHYPNQDFREKILISEMSKDFFMEQAEEIKEAINYGNLMHDVLSEIERKEDVKPTIEKLIHLGKLPEDEGSAMEQKILSFFELDQFASWFAQGNEIRKEQTILVPGQKEDKRPDRVVITKNKVEIIDFKFGTTPAEHYQRQLLEYKKILEGMGYENVSAFLFFGNESRIEKVSPDSNAQQTSLF